MIFHIRRHVRKTVAERSVVKTTAATREDFKLPECVLRQTARSDKDPLNAQQGLCHVPTFVQLPHQIGARCTGVVEDKLRKTRSACQRGDSANVSATAKARALARLA